MTDANIIQIGANPLCGDHLALYIKHDGTNIIDAKFQGKGCAISQASASMLTDELIGMSLKDAANISKENILEMLGVQLGPARIKCGLLIWDTLKEGLEKS